MGVRKAVYTILANDATVAAAVIDRIHFDFIPQSTDFPAVVVSIISVIPYDTKSGPSTLDEIRVQIDIYDRKKSGVNDLEDLGEAIRTALDRYPHVTVSGVSLGGIRYLEEENLPFNDDLELFQKAIDFQIRVKR